MRVEPAPAHHSLRAIVAEGFLSRLSFGIIGFALPLYAYRRLGLNLAETSLLFTLNSIAEQALKPGMGWAADRFGLKRSLTAAVGLRSVVALLLVFASTPWQVSAIRLLHGVSESLRDPAVNALIAEKASQRRLASSFAWYSTAKSVAGSLGKAAGGLLLALTSDQYCLVFFVAFLLSALPLYVVARHVHEGEPVGGAEDEPRGPLDDGEPGPKVEDGGDRVESRAAVVPLVVLSCLIAGTANMMQALFPILAVEYGGLSTAETGAIYTISVLVLLVAGPLFGWLSDNGGQRLVLAVRGVMNAISSLVYLFFPTLTGLTAGNVADAVGKAAFRPAWGAVMAHVSRLDRRRRARTISYLCLGEGLGETLGPLLAGFLWQTWGIAVMLGVRACLALAGEVYLAALNRPPGRPSGGVPTKFFGSRHSDLSAIPFNES